MRFDVSGDDVGETRQGVGRYRSALLVSDVDRESLSVALMQPIAAVIEAVEGQEPLGDWVAVAVPEDGIYLSLTTGSAFGIQLAALICDALVERGVLTRSQRSVVELCLQEAVANAIIHGNLGIASTAKDHPEGYRVFSQLVSERMGDPVLCRRRVDLFCRWAGRTLEISVVDQGAGFDVSILPADVAATSRSGRGFIFMRALASRVITTDGGRCTSLRFDL